MAVSTDAFGENVSLIKLGDSRTDHLSKANPVVYQGFPSAALLAIRPRIACGPFCVALSLSLMAHLALAYLTGDFLPARPVPVIENLTVYLNQNQALSPSIQSENSHSAKSSPSLQQPAEVTPAEQAIPDANKSTPAIPASSSVAIASPAAQPDPLPVDHPEPAQSPRKPVAHQPTKKKVVIKPKKPTPPGQSTKPAPSKEKTPSIHSKPPTRQAQKAEPPSPTPKKTPQLRTTDQSTTARAAQGRTAERRAAKSTQEAASSTATNNTPPRSVEAAPLPDNPKPRYPLVARKRGVEGRVVLQVTVLSTGSAANVKIKTGSGHAQLDRAALEAVRRWRFRPAQQGGQPISAVLDVPIVFRLNG